MKLKYQLIFSDDEFPPVSIGIKVGIFYDIDWDHYDYACSNQKISLFTLCYRPKQKDFVRIQYVRLPKRLRQRYENAYNYDQTIRELEGIGIHCYQDVAGIVDKFHEYQDLLVYENYQNSLGESDMVYQKMLEVQDMLTSKQLVKKNNDIPRIKDFDQE